MQVPPVMIVMAILSSEIIYANALLAILTLARLIVQDVPITVFLVVVGKSARSVQTDLSKMVMFVLHVPLIARSAQVQASAPSVKMAMISKMMHVQAIPLVSFQLSHKTIIKLNVLLDVQRVQVLLFVLPAL